MPRLLWLRLAILASAAWLTTLGAVGLVIMPMITPRFETPSLVITDWSSVEATVEDESTYDVGRLPSVLLETSSLFGVIHNVPEQMVA